MATFDTPEPDPNRPARCPRQLLGSGPRCRALVLVRDADEHGSWHDRLDEALQAPVETTELEVAEWPEHDAELTETTAGRPGL